MSNFRGNIVRKFDKLPPFTVYALARNFTRWRTRATLAQLVEASGLPQRTFMRIARKLSWAGVKIENADRFCEACRVDLLRQMPTRNYMKHSLKHKRPFAHLSDQQYKTFLRQCKEWKEMRQTQGPL